MALGLVCVSVGGVYKGEGKMKGEHTAGERRGVCDTTYYIIMSVLTTDLKQSLEIIGFYMFSNGLR